MGPGYPRDTMALPGSVVIGECFTGHALAGGLQQVLACDLRVAAEHATFGVTEVRWAIMPGAGKAR